MYRFGWLLIVLAVLNLMAAGIHYISSKSIWVNRKWGEAVYQLPRESPEASAMFDASRTAIKSIGRAWDASIRRQAAMDAVNAVVLLSGGILLVRSGRRGRLTKAAVGSGGIA